MTGGATVGRKKGDCGILSHPHPRSTWTDVRIWGKKQVVKKALDGLKVGSRIPLLLVYVSSLFFLLCLGHDPEGLLGERELLLSFTTGKPFYLYLTARRDLEKEERGVGGSTLTLS